MGDTGSVTGRRAGSQGHHRLPGRQRLAGWFLGLAGGLGVNALSADVGYRGVAAAAAVATVLISSNWVRQFPPTAPLTRMAVWVLLGGAGLAAVLAAVNPGWEGSATLAATGLTTAAVLIPTEVRKAAELLTGVALIGAGVTLIGVGVAVLREGELLGGVAVIGIGVAGIGIGVAVLRQGDLLGGVASIGAGVALIGAGVAALREGDLLAGVAVIGAGVAGIGVGVAALREGDLLFGVAGIGFGVTIVRRIGVFVPVVTWLTSLTKASRDEVVSHDDVPRS